MAKIRFSIDGEEYSVTIDSIDPARAYDKADEIAQVVQENGYHFREEQAIDRTDISLAAHDRDDENILLGDISDRVAEGEAPVPPGPGPDDEDKDEIPDVDDDYVVQVEGPDGKTETIGLSEGQNLGALLAEISTKWNLSLEEHPTLYADEQRTNPVDNSRMAGSVDGDYLYWDYMDA